MDGQPILDPNKKGAFLGPPSVCNSKPLFMGGFEKIIREKELKN
jgi:hypothetical protein